MVRIDRHLVLSNGVHKIDIGKFVLIKRSGVYIICEINIFAPPPLKIIFFPQTYNIKTGIFYRFPKPACIYFEEVFL